MKNISDKKNHIPSFLIEAIELEDQKIFLLKRIKTIIGKLETLNEIIMEKRTMLETMRLFPRLIQKCYPEQAQSVVIQKALKQLNELDFKSVEELKDFIAKVLFCIYFSKGKDRVFDLNDANFYDDEVCQKLFDQEIFIPEQWLEQFILCLNVKDAKEDMILHNLTPEWLWPRVFPMLMELYQLTQESIKNKK